MEKFKKNDPSLMGKIKGCIVDSAPVAAPDPQVRDNAELCLMFTLLNSISWEFSRGRLKL